MVGFANRRVSMGGGEGSEEAAAGKVTGIGVDSSGGVVVFCAWVGRVGLAAERHGESTFLDGEVGGRVAEMRGRQERTAVVQ